MWKGNVSSEQGLNWVFTQERVIVPACEIHNRVLRTRVELQVKTRKPGAYLERITAGVEAPRPNSGKSWMEHSVLSRKLPEANYGRRSTWDSMHLSAFERCSKFWGW